MSMNFFYNNIDALTLKNTNYRKVLYTVPGNFQLVVMALLPGEEIGSEIHPHTTQFIRIERGLGISIIDGEISVLNEGSAVVVPPGIRHNIKNISDNKLLQLYTIYTPPEHQIGTIQRNKPME